ncbi:hypothetical protein [Streptomyces sp. B5E4]|uniref:hypothetical protein n=1 Tax=Streptomyces sp. B5E4 TaxID=3153568 RepID=UPI00325DDCE2
MDDEETSDEVNDEDYDDDAYAEDGGSGPPERSSADPDVLLDVPQLKVDQITLDVENLRARVSLRAEVLSLMGLNVGADVSLGGVHLDIHGVEAQALLKVRLDNVAEIIGRVLTTIDHNPQILEQVASGVGGATEDVAGEAGRLAGELGHGAEATAKDAGGRTRKAADKVGKALPSGVEEPGGSPSDAEGSGHRCREGEGEGGTEEESALVAPADIAFSSTVEADRLRFRAPPHTEVRFSGAPGSRSSTSSSRTNLPSPVSEGVDYERVRIAYRLRNQLRTASPTPTS